MAISGMESLTPDEVADELSRGARFVVFQYCISLVFITFRRASKIHFIRAGHGTFARSLPYTLVSLLLGIWGIPWGLIFAPAAIMTNLLGGKNVTDDVLASIKGASRSSAGARASR